MHTESEVRHPECVAEPPFPGMVWIPGGTFRMGSDKHYPEERPSHRVTVDGFWIDRYPVTNEQFARFVLATGHVTFAEIPPNPADYPRLTHQLVIWASAASFAHRAGRPVKHRRTLVRGGGFLSATSPA
jgi:formylglycine-generating enzyme required for sulfatase activity